MVSKIRQFFCSHDWTSAAQQGIEATPEQLSNGVEGFWDYATMYCSKCGKVSELSKRHGS